MGSIGGVRRFSLKLDGGWGMDELWLLLRDSDFAILGGFSSDKGLLIWRSIV